MVIGKRPTVEDIDMYLVKIFIRTDYIKKNTQGNLARLTSILKIIKVSSWNEERY